MNNKAQSTVLECHNLTVSFNEKPVLWNIDFSLPPGKMTGIVGANGSGKTTLLRAIMGLIKVDSGHVRIMGEELDKVRSLVSYVPQKESVDWTFPITVEEVVEMGRYHRHNLFGRLSSADKEKVEESLIQVGLIDFRKRQISQLSGGQQQRVFLARALCKGASLMILDEPFAGVDAASEDSILSNLQNLKRQGCSVIVVHHDLHTALQNFEYLILLNQHLIACGPAEEVFTQKNLEKAYGGNPIILSVLGQSLQNKNQKLRTEL